MDSNQIWHSLSYNLIRREKPRTLVAILWLAIAIQACTASTTNPGNGATSKSHDATGCGTVCPKFTADQLLTMLVPYMVHEFTRLHQFKTEIRGKWERAPLNPILYPSIFGTDSFNTNQDRALALQKLALQDFRDDSDYPGRMTRNPRDQLKRQYSEDKRYWPAIRFATLLVYAIAAEYFSELNPDIPEEVTRWLATNKNHGLDVIFSYASKVQSFDAEGVRHIDLGALSDKQPQSEQDCSVVVDLFYKARYFGYGRYPARNVPNQINRPEGNPSKSYVALYGEPWEEPSEWTSFLTDYLGGWVPSFGK